MGINERKEREKQRRREDILDAAEKIFFTKGYEISTMDDVAEMAELSKGTLYLYFKSKEEIHWEITQRHMGNPAKNAIENLLTMARIFIAHFDEEHHSAHSVFFFQACDLSKLNLDQDHIRHAFIYESPIHLVTKYVELGVQQGLIRDDIPVKALSTTLWAQMMGVMQIIILKMDLFKLIDVSKEAILDSHIKIILNGLLKNEKK
jgi:TetR/AcrR family transcriptional regulator